MWAIDKNVAYFFLHYIHSNATHVVKIFSELFDNSLIFAIIGFAMFYKDRKKLIKFALFIIVIAIFIFTSKYFVARQRPFAFLNLKNYLNLFENASFPSGHTGFSLLFAWFLTFNKKNKVLIVCCWIFAILISLSRIIILAHYVSDVFISALIVSFLYFALEYIYKRYFDEKTII